MSEVILCNLSDAPQILQEKRKEWVLEMLELLGVPQELRECNDIAQFRGGLAQLGIHVEAKSAGQEIDLYKLGWHGDEEGGWLPVSEKYLVAQWKMPKYIKRVEGYDVFYELHTNEWSMLRK